MLGTGKKPDLFLYVTAKVRHGTQSNCSNKANCSCFDAGAYCDLRHPQTPETLLKDFWEPCSHLGQQLAVRCDAL